jgi:hypothetical protein
MSNDEGFKPTTPGFKKDDTQPIPLARRTLAQAPAESLASTEAPTEMAAATLAPSSTPEPMRPAAPLISPQLTPTQLPAAREIPTPPSLSAAQMRLQRSIRVLWMAMVAVAALALVSLAINVVLVTRLLAIRNEVAAALSDASRSLDNLSGQGFAFDFPISQTVNFEGDVPFKQDIAFPFKSNIPIDTTISVPVELGLLGRQIINVPVKTTVPVDITVPVHVEQTFHVKTQVPVKMNVPVRIGPNDPPLKDLIVQARQWLERIRKYF